MIMMMILMTMSPWCKVFYNTKALLICFYLSVLALVVFVIVVGKRENNKIYDKAINRTKT